MEITRLDEVIKRYVANSATSSNEAQIVYLLQDISETLAMIYDKIGKNSPTLEENIEAHIIDCDSLTQGQDIYIEFKYPNVIYTAQFKQFDEKKGKQIAIFTAFDEPLEVNIKDYNKKWRCWNTDPKNEEMEEAKWRN